MCSPFKSGELNALPLPPMLLLAMPGLSEGSWKFIVSSLPLLRLVGVVVALLLLGLGSLSADEDMFDG